MSEETMGSDLKGGVIVLHGSFVEKHRIELVELVRMTECLSFLADAALWIERITEQEDRVVIETAAAGLAEKIGVRLCAVCGGAVRTLSGESGDNRTWLAWTRNDDARSR